MYLGNTFFYDANSARLPCLLKGRALMITLTTQSTVHVGSTDYNLLWIARVSEGKQGLFAIRTPNAQRIELLHSIGHRNTIENVSKRLSVEISIESHQKDILLQSVDRKLNELNKSLEKLGLLHNDHLVAIQEVPVHTPKIGDRNTRSPSVVMRGHLMGRIALVRRMLDDKNRNLQGRIPRDDGKNTGGLPREHGTYDDLERHWIYYIGDV
jgi:hypothetical protein